MDDLQTIISKVLSFLSETWGLSGSLVVALICHKLLKTGIHIILTIAVIGVALFLLTHFGILPPLPNILPIGA